MTTTIATYSVGPPQRPTIHHDNGFLDHCTRRSPSATDLAQYALWAAKLEAGEAAQGLPLAPELPDALAAYRHFLYGEGADRQFSYERYVEGDPSGRTTLRNLIADAQLGAEQLYARRDPSRPVDLQMVSTAIPCGAGNSRCPYPQTENWQKAIGAHWVWLSATVSVTAEPDDPRFTMLLTLHAEDRYNFNPGQQDIATGIPDAANGRFECSGLAEQYTNYAQLTRRIAWRRSRRFDYSAAEAPSGRLRQPADNLRLRNRW